MTSRTLYAIRVAKSSQACKRRSGLQYSACPWKPHGIFSENIAHTASARPGVPARKAEFLAAEAGFLMYRSHFYYYSVLYTILRRRRKSSRSIAPALSYVCVVQNPSMPLLKTSLLRAGTGSVHRSTHKPRLSQKRPPIARPRPGSAQRWGGTTSW